MKYAWIAKHIVMWPITPMCEVLGVSASGFFEYRSLATSPPAGKPSSVHVSNEALLTCIRAIHAQSKQEYGWPRVWKELLARDIRVGKDRAEQRPAQLLQRLGHVGERRAIAQCPGLTLQQRDVVLPKGHEMASSWLRTGSGRCR